MRANEANLIPPWQTLRFRLLGFLPLCFYIARAIEYMVIAKTPEQMLWSCHVSNLMLALGMFMGNPFLIRVAVFWQILGLPPWIMDAVMSGLIKMVSIFSHLGGYSQGYEDRAMPTIAGNMGKFLAGDLRSMINIVRKPASWKD